MSQMPPGWYPDPDPAAPQGSTRYWDGAQWTQQVQPPGAGEYVGKSYPGAGGYAGSPAVPTTPDGQRLAGWWRRAGAYLIDGWLVALPLTLLLAWPFYARMWAAYRRWLAEVFASAERGVPPPDATALMGQIWVPLAFATLIGFAVHVVYHSVMLKWKQASVGKLLLGLRVRLRDQPGPLPWGTVLRRVLAQFWSTAAAAIPYVGNVAGLWIWIDCLWPLADQQRQALHDKFAATNVVDIRT